eukprot:scaffold140_cov565-Prasinococcus_capsulatus_cf.AAC.39
MSYAQRWLLRAGKSLGNPAQCAWASRQACCLHIPAILKRYHELTLISSRPLEARTRAHYEHSLPQAGESSSSPPPARRCSFGCE